jgi:hypothetical protein
MASTTLLTHIATFAAAPRCSLPGRQSQMAFRFAFTIVSVRTSSRTLIAAVVDTFVCASRSTKRQDFAVDPLQILMMCDDDETEDCDA